jgi:hypothetical protein
MDPIQPDPGSNPNCFGGKPATSRLIYGMDYRSTQLRLDIDVSAKRPPRVFEEPYRDVFLLYLSVVRFEVFKAVTMKNGVFWDVTPYGSSKN